MQFPERSDDAAWTDLEQSFFASGLAEEAEASAPAADFDDLLSSPRPPRELPAPLRRSLAALSQRLVAARSLLRLDRKGITIALASLVVLMGLSAGVVASRSGARAASPTAAWAGPTGTGRVAQAEEAGPPPSAPGPRRHSSNRSPSRHPKAAKRPPHHQRKAATSPRHKDVIVPSVRPPATQLARGSAAPTVPTSRPFFSR